MISYKPPYNGRGLKRFATKGRPCLTNYPTRWEYQEYWKMSILWGYPRLEIWGRPYAGSFDPKRWTRIGTLLDGMPIGQSLWLEHAKRFDTPLDLAALYPSGFCLPPAGRFTVPVSPWAQQAAGFTRR